ncbi:restriction endonuclease subunit S [Gilliamella sp. Imp1-1]|uniref:restriction endonuclease subunit S n=1 Tax=Gilliamella sp. Imp1-1 TaxID=3120248 RepID=UPI000557F455|nr:restriction endonuclease subunit S [Gilliamella apicola]OCG57608.1 restriction endonuclease subunit S [Gilliamella apicola]
MQNSIAKLLDNVTVEWKALGDVAEVGTGNANRQDENEHGQYPFYVRSKNILKSKNFQFDETAIVIPGEGGIGDIFHYIEGKYALHQRAYRIHVFSNKLNTKYLYYLMCDKFKQYILTKCVGATSISIRKPMLEQFQIPIPPLHIQTEIVRILDTFTALTAELTAELTTRKKQYNYYRDKLLTFQEDEVEWKALGEVGQLIRGNGLQKKDFTETGVPAIHYGQIYTYYGTFATETKSFVSSELAKKLKKAKYGDILLAGTSENIKDVMTPLGWLGGEIVFSGDMYAFRPNNVVNTKYLTYLLQTTHFQKFKEKYANGTKVIRIQSEKFLTFNIPIPPLKEQARIVEILDKFDVLTNSITEGLPREIELRQKQYEYYRNLLLNFSVETQ